MKLSFHGAARTVTGSKHIVHIGTEKKLLLDCGMFQGMGKDTIRLNSEWGFEPSELTYVIISHAHVDHIGLLPKLVKDGYHGKIFCTVASEPLIRVLLLDSAKIQQDDVRYHSRHVATESNPSQGPLYTEADAMEVFPMLVPIDYNVDYEIEKGINLKYTDAGHILGSAVVNLTIEEDGKTVRLCFSGDVGRYGDTILNSPEVFPQADFIIMESTYGDRLHHLATVAYDKILHQIQHTCIEKKGKLIIPAFSLGRTQELLYILNRFELENRLPPVHYYVDSPLSLQITDITKQFPQCFNKHVRKQLEADEDVFDFKGLKTIKSAEQSISLNTTPEPCVIISASGMAEAGRVKHHIKHAISNARNTILFSGYCEPHSLGGRIRSGARQVRIYGELFDVNAEIDALESLSAHGDYEDLCQWLACQDVKQVRKLFLVHGEYETQLNFKDRLIRKGFSDVSIPAQHEMIGLGI
ncbi:MAG: MBL fold metallo-hydrolase [Bacteroidetes bacterium]|nr:MBL fold metallo-hydrolase [Bacteroidota bacterium]